ncbi:radical SAM family heme chaperone HemW [Oscillatoria sp. FACHB-1407]|uniref:radical SAM family heme chaperone HemW n=1 Tax=Oscillatoria sp. FACHB-1407 TaxID=2692847 RepID=UPI001F554725|nr:radical SAM family heme chaperone HemW [Oscillatoria sp. FACHB-1407]
MTAPTAAYIHIPFCRRRCFYCDFPVSIVGDRTRGETSGAIAQYVEVLCQEILTTPQQGEILQTIFLGGGTPSLLSIEQLEQILKTLDRHFGIALDAEISIEMDPGTFDLAHLKGYHAAGINRVSLGVQSFQTEQLKACGRTHTVEDVYEAIALIHQVGVSNFSLDLISGLPHQTLETWCESVEAAIAIAPTHLSVYDLIVEPMTAFGRWYQPGESPLPTDIATAEMYRLARQKLTQAGYEHYEISNYAKSGYQCRHNRVYWENRPYYGFGMGAASYVLGQRFTRPRKRQEYFQWVQTLVEDHGKIDCPITPPDEVLLDTLMVGLRLAEGISLDALKPFGTDQVESVLQRLRPYQHQGWIEITSESTSAPRIRLTDPEGFLFSNVVLTRLFEDI